MAARCRLGGMHLDGGRPGYSGAYLCSLVPMFPGTYVPWYLCSLVPMFPGTYVPRYLCSPVTRFPEPMFPGTYVPRTYVPRYLCSPIFRLIFLSLQIVMNIHVVIFAHERTKSSANSIAQHICCPGCFSSSFLS